MEFPFALTGLPVEGEPVSMWDRQRIAGLTREGQGRLGEVLQTLGLLSAKAQNIPSSVTSLERILASDQRVYLVAIRPSSTRTVVIGGIKAGKRKLFLHNPLANYSEAEPVCLLDFYVHESYQRQGYGKLLFEHFLQVEGLTPDAVAYDLPSAKCLTFLQKHYGLTDTVPQQNKFVVFIPFFQRCATVQHGKVAFQDHRSRQSRMQQRQDGRMRLNMGGSHYAESNAVVTSGTVTPAGSRGVENGIYSGTAVEQSALYKVGSAELVTSTSQPYHNDEHERSGIYTPHSNASSSHMQHPTGFLSQQLLQNHGTATAYNAFSSRSMNSSRASSVLGDEDDIISARAQAKLQRSGLGTKSCLSWQT